MKRIVFLTAISLALTAGAAFGQMGDGGHMMEAFQQPQAQTPAPEGGQPNVGFPGYGMGQMYPGMMGGYGMHQPMMGYGAGQMNPGMHQPQGGYGMGHMNPGMMGGYGMSQPMMGYGMGHMHSGMHQPQGGFGMGQMNPAMMGGCGMHQLQGGYGKGQMSPGMMGGYGMYQPMMGYGAGHMHSGMHQPRAGFGMPHHMNRGPGGGVEKQRAFMKETSGLRKKIHDLVFDYMETSWDADAEPGQIEKIGEELQGLQKELYEKSREDLK